MYLVHLAVQVSREIGGLSRFAKLAAYAKGKLTLPQPHKARS